MSSDHDPETTSALLKDGTYGEAVLKVGEALNAMRNCVEQNPTFGRLAQLEELVALLESVDRQFSEVAAIDHPSPDPSWRDLLGTTKL